MTARRIFDGLPKAPTWPFHYAMHIMLKYYLQQIKWLLEAVFVVRVTGGPHGAVGNSYNIQMSGNARNVRRFCKACYNKNSKQLGRTRAKNLTKKVVTYCSDCVDSPFLCLQCINLTHRNMALIKCISCTNAIIFVCSILH